MAWFKRMAWRARLRYSGKVLDNLQEARRWQAFNREELEQAQQEKLQRLLLHAYTHVPYYQALFKACGIKRPEDIRREHLADLPLLDKATIRKEATAMRSNDLSTRKWHENTSGGSTGEPVRFVQDRVFRDWAVAMSMLFDTWSGYRTGDKKILVWGSERDLFAGREKLTTQISLWLQNEVRLNSFRMTPEQMRRYVETINQYKPVQILAYAESIHELARFIEQEGLSVYSPRAVMSSAGSLHDDMRKTIERVFACRVYDRYGSREVGAMACEHPEHKGFLVSAPTQFIEILKEDGSPAKEGEVGEVVVTSLVNFAMPLIRYRIGDMASWAAEDENASIVWPRLASLKGRVTDTFRKADGSQIHGEYFTHLFYFLDWVKQFQVIQESFTDIRVLIATDLPKESCQDDLEEIRAKICLVMGEACQVSFDFVDDIPPSVSGKHRYTISKLKSA